MEIPSPIPLTVIILTFNEERNLSPCLESVVGWTEKIFVVDSGSSDRTKDIAQQYRSVVAEHPFETHAKQWDWALRNLPLTTDWILGLDADQRTDDKLKQEITHLFSKDQNGLQQIEGIYVRRKQIFRGRWIRHGGYGSKYLLKFFRRDKVRIDSDDRIDHHFFVSGKVLKLSGALIEENHKENDLNFWIEKHIHYAELQAEEELQRRRNGQWPISPSLFGTPDQRILWQKKFWYRLPLYLRSFLYFFWRYILQGGFLDGKEGLIFHFLHALWYRILIDIHLDELIRNHDYPRS